MCESRAAVFQMLEDLAAENHIEALTQGVLLNIEDFEFEPRHRRAISSDSFRREIRSDQALRHWKRVAQLDQTLAQAATCVEHGPKSFSEQQLSDQPPPMPRPRIEASVIAEPGPLRVVAFRVEGAVACVGHSRQARRKARSSV